MAERETRPQKDTTSDEIQRVKRRLRPSIHCAIMNRKLTASEIAAALNSTSWKPILTPEDAADLLRIKVSTLYRHVSEGRYAGAVSRGKPLRFWRDRLIQEFMR